MSNSPYFTRSFQRAFGTFPLRGEQLVETLGLAFAAGYRAIDTAQMYQNEAAVGQALLNSDIRRDELLITTKVPNSKFSVAEFLPSVERSMKDLQIDKIDVLLLHWPPADFNIDAPVRLLESAKKAGLTKHIGVSNFTVAMMRRLRELTAEPIVTNQVEFHPLLNQEKLLAAAQETSIPLASYCSVARGKVFDYPIFTDIAKSHNVAAGQVVLRWIMQKGVSVNTMSTNPVNIKNNFEITDFELTPDEMQRIDALGSHQLRIVDKELVPWAPNWD